MSFKQTILEIQHLNFIFIIYHVTRTVPLVEGSDRAGPDRAGPDRTEHDRTGHDRTGPDRTGPACTRHGGTLSVR